MDYLQELRKLSFNTAHFFSWQMSHKQVKFPLQFYLFHFLYNYHRCNSLIAKSLIYFLKWQIINKGSQCNNLLWFPEWHKHWIPWSILFVNTVSFTKIFQSWFKAIVSFGKLFQCLILLLVAFLFFFACFLHFSVQLNSVPQSSYSCCSSVNAEEDRTGPLWSHVNEVTDLLRISKGIY